jgi:hypothetical protein
MQPGEEVETAPTVRCRDCLGEYTHGAATAHTAGAGEVPPAFEEVVLMFNNEFSWMTHKEVELTYRVCKAA